MSLFLGRNDFEYAQKNSILLIFDELVNVLSCQRSKFLKNKIFSFYKFSMLHRCSVWFPHVCCLNFLGFIKNIGFLLKVPSFFSRDCTPDHKWWTLENFSISIFFKKFDFLFIQCRSISAKPTGLKKGKDIPKLPDS